MLKNIAGPDDIKLLSIEKLNDLACEIRTRIIEVVAKNGGHLASSLGTVELIISLHKIFNTPTDKILFDVGHQSYAHKILTNRNCNLESLRKLDGLSGFMSPRESKFDPFIAGHAGNSISAGLGMAIARDLSKETNKIISVIGDGSIGTGMALEALNHAGGINADLIVVLNDNRMSISPNVGALSQYLNNIITGVWYNKLRSELDPIVESIVGSKVTQVAKRFEDTIKGIMTPGRFFEELGFKYVGPIDGHAIKYLNETFSRVSQLKGPVLVHVITTKGKGYNFAEESADNFHGVAPFNLENGKSLKVRSEAKSYTDIFSDTLIELAETDEKIVAITAAMEQGTGLTRFSKKFPDRYFDVGIAEQHAGTFAAGLATSGYKPVVAIYSTFLQRLLDQMIHDVAIMNLNVIFAIDRAGVVGEDGATHQGLFDLSYLRMIPNFTIMSPKNGAEMKAMLKFATTIEGPVAIRYPRGAVSEFDFGQSTLPKIEYPKSELLLEGDDHLVIATGSTVEPAYRALKSVRSKGINATLINVRFIKPLDKELILDHIHRSKYILTIEENVIKGGLGSAVLELLNSTGFHRLNIKMLGAPDKFIPHGSQSAIRNILGIDSNGIERAVIEQRSFVKDTINGLSREEFQKTARLTSN